MNSIEEVVLAYAKECKKELNIDPHVHLPFIKLVTKNVVDTEQLVMENGLRDIPNLTVVDGSGNNISSPSTISLELFKSSNKFRRDSMSEHDPDYGKPFSENYFRIYQDDMDISVIDSNTAILQGKMFVKREHFQTIELTSTDILLKTMPFFSNPDLVFAFERLMATLNFVVQKKDINQAISDNIVNIYRNTRNTFNQDQELYICVFRTHYTSSGKSLTIFDCVGGERKSVLATLYLRRIRVLSPISNKQVDELKSVGLKVEEYEVYPRPFTPVERGSHDQGCVIC